MGPPAPQAFLTQKYEQMCVRAPHTPPPEAAMALGERQVNAAGRKEAGVRPVHATGSSGTSSRSKSHTQAAGRRASPTRAARGSRWPTLSDADRACARCERVPAEARTSIDGGDVRVDDSPLGGCEGEGHAGGDDAGAHGRGRGDTAGFYTISGIEVSMSPPPPPPTRIWGGRRHACNAGAGSVFPL